MTGLSPFTPGAELHCRGCQMNVGSIMDPACLLAIELADDGERMSPHCCPPAEPCPVCGGPLPCEACLAELRMAS